MAWFSFNRNIMECKYPYQCGWRRWNKVLIETLWNVNITEYNNITKVPFGFNRNIMECKYIVDVGKDITDSSFNRNIMECKYNLQLHNTIRNRRNQF